MLSVTSLTSNHSTGGASKTTASISPAANSLLVLSVGYSGATVSAITGVTGLGLTWAFQTTVSPANSGSYKYDVWTAVTGSSPGSDTIVITFGTFNPSSTTWDVDQATGIDTTTPIIVASTKTAHGLNTSNPALTYNTPSAGNLLWFGTALAGFSASSPNTGWTELADVQAGASPSVSLETQISPSSPGTSGASTPAVAEGWGAIGMEIKAFVGTTFTQDESGELDLTGSLTPVHFIQTAQVVSGALTPTGNLTTSHAVGQPVSGSVALTGALARKVIKRFQSATNAFGDLGRLGQYPPKLQSLGGSLHSAGALTTTRLKVHSESGSLPSIGSLTTSHQETKLQSESGGVPLSGSLNAELFTPELGTIYQDGSLIRERISAHVYPLDGTIYFHAPSPTIGGHIVINRDQPDGTIIINPKLPFPATFFNDSPDGTIVLSNTGPLLTVFTVKALVPSHGVQGTSMTVDISGTGFVQTAELKLTAILGNPGDIQYIDTTDVHFYSDSHVAIDIEIADNAPVGQIYALTFINGDDLIIVKPNAFGVEAQMPTDALAVNYVLPNALVQNQKHIDLIIQGQGFMDPEPYHVPWAIPTFGPNPPTPPHATANEPLLPALAPAVTFSNPGVTVNSVTFNTNNQLTVNVSTTEGTQPDTGETDATLGRCDMTVTNADGSYYVAHNIFSVEPWYDFTDLLLMDMWVWMTDDHKKYLESIGDMWDVLCLSSETYTGTYGPFAPTSLYELASDQGIEGTAGFEPAWSKLLNVDTCPGAFLPYLSMFNGTGVMPNQDYTDARQQIRDEIGFRRGTPLAIINTAEKYCKPGTTVTITERLAADGVDEDPYWFGLNTEADDMILPGEYQHLIDAVNAVKPAGLWWTLNGYPSPPVGPVPPPPPPPPPPPNPPPPPPPPPEPPKPPKHEHCEWHESEKRWRDCDEWRDDRDPDHREHNKRVCWEHSFKGDV